MSLPGFIIPEPANCVGVLAYAPIAATGPSIVSTTALPTLVASAAGPAAAVVATAPNIAPVTFLSIAFDTAPTTGALAAVAAATGLDTVEIALSRTLLAAGEALLGKLASASGLVFTSTPFPAALHGAWAGARLAIVRSLPGAARNPFCVSNKVSV